MDKVISKLQDAFKTTSEERSVTESPSIGAPGIPFLAMKKKKAMKVIRQAR